MISTGKDDGKVHGLRGPCSIIALFCAERLLVNALILNTVLLPSALAFLKFHSNVLICITVPSHITFLFKLPQEISIKMAGGRGLRHCYPYM